MSRKMINFVPTLFVGLGGTGQKVVGRIKRRMALMFPDVPDLPVHYLVLDTDSQQRTEFEFQADEYIEISNFDGEAVLNRLDRYPMIQAWWPPNLKPSDVGNVDFGAGQTRPVGRMAYFYWYTQRIKEVLETKAKQLTRVRSASELQALEDKGIALDGNTVAVYVIASLAGGNGSGLFLDVAFEIRNHLRLRKGTEMIGVFVMPEGFVRIVPKGLQVDRVQANSYAALKELDYFMDAENAKKLTLQYASSARAFSPEQAIFDSVSLVDIIDAKGNELEDVRQLYDMIASKLTLELFVAGERRSAARNIRIRREVVLGRRRHYDSFGVGALVFHAAQAAEYGRLIVAFRILAEMTREVPMDREILGFLNRASLQEHGADLLLDQFRPVYRGRLSRLVPSEPQDPSTALDEAKKAIERIRVEMGRVRTEMQKGVARIAERAAKMLDEEMRTRLGRADVSLSGLRSFLERMRAYITTTLVQEMEKEKKELEADVRKGRADEAFRHLREWAEGTWIPVVKSRQIRTWFKRWHTTVTQYLDGWAETEARTAAQQVYARFVPRIDEWLGRIRPLETAFENASRWAYEQAGKIVRDVQREIASSFKLIEGVVDPGPVSGEEGTRFDKIVKEYEPPLRARIEDLLRATNGLQELLGERAPSDPATLLEQVLLPLLAKDFLEIHEVDVLEAVRRWNPGFDARRALTRIIGQCRPFLSVDREALGEERRPEMLFFVGVPDPYEPKYKEILKEDVLGVKVQPVATGDRSRVIVLVTDIGYPSHILTFLKDYRHYYQQFSERAARGESEFVHLHKDWAGDALPDLLPPE